MGRAIKCALVCAMVAITYFMISGATCSARQAAPYTRDAYVRIEKAETEYKPSQLADSATALERQEAAMQRFRDIFRIAGYDFDATIRQVARDLKDNPERVPRGGENVATMVIVVMSYMKSHCAHDRIDCLKLFDSHTAESVKWLWENTGFTP